MSDKLGYRSDCTFWVQNEFNESYKEHEGESHRNAPVPIAVKVGEDKEFDAVWPSGLSPTKESVLGIPVWFFLCDCFGCVQEYFSRFHLPTVNGLYGSFVIQSLPKSTFGVHG